ncbi:alpha/beta-hydrolase [Melanogaster broomeanus]|nr:alpha/beta-hydrolase [Melanogaster broomeanus]
MELIEHRDIPYVPESESESESESVPQNPFHTFDVYIPKHLRDHSDQHDAALGLVCFIHGGAWRSRPSRLSRNDDVNGREDKADHADLARRLAASTGYAVALPNYRLTTPDNYLHHPEHAKDLLRFLEFIRSGRQRALADVDRADCFSSATAAQHICCAPSSLRTPGETLRPSDELVQSTTAIIMSEGIYDIDLLLSSFPTYRTWFIEAAFGKRDSFEDVSVLKAPFDPKGDHIQWLIIHSQGDTLVDERQSSAMYDYLSESSRPVTKTFDELGDEHNDILQGTQYVEIINKYIKGLVDAE